MMKARWSASSRSGVQKMLRSAPRLMPVRAAMWANVTSSRPPCSISSVVDVRIG